MGKLLTRLKKLQREAFSSMHDRWSGENEETATTDEKIIRFWAFVYRSFVHNRLTTRAAALTYATLLALIPMLAVAISIATALLKTEKGQEQVETQIEELIDTTIQRFAPQLDLEVKPVKGSKAIVRPGPVPTNTLTGTNLVVSTNLFIGTNLVAGTNVVAAPESNRKQVTETIKSSIKNVQSGKLGATAMVILVFIAISLLSSVENTLNDIWGIKRGRTWLARIIQYWAVITLGPILLLVAITWSAKQHVQMTQLVPGAEIISGVVSEFIPFIVFTAIFTVLYRLMPNTKVENRAAFVGGCFGGLLLYLNNKFSMIYFGQVARNFEIYGSLGSVPVFLVGLYFSWVILLLGAQVAYAYQNRRAYFQEKQAENINERGREFVALRIMTLVAERFQTGERPPTTTEISEQLSIPTRLVAKIVEPLLSNRLLVEVKTGEKEEVGYDPGRPLDKISYQDILDGMRTATGLDVLTKDDDMRKLVAEQFENIHAAESRIGANINLHDLTARQKPKSISSLD